MTGAWVVDVEMDRKRCDFEVLTSDFWMTWQILYLSGWIRLSSGLKKPHERWGSFRYGNVCFYFSKS
ncbi:hypothetical protein Lalb_Chr08g0244841 [Lupinus albus]|uniref:Uncharacterized protein n=1 Tax=Lupinus albus TaxID=3870 RepID=A0A6A4Q707_LUPAL|nr:hypothetical protein Lalb_Chr08g0244841 [Lupinus albus]